MKTHLNLATAKLTASVAFYRTLLNTAPVKVLADYALFVTEEPAMELALDLHSPVRPSKRRALRHRSRGRRRRRPRDRG
jgi:hypothetical protein